MKVPKIVWRIFFASLFFTGCAINISNSQNTQGAATAQKERDKNTASRKRKIDEKNKIKLKFSKKASAGISSATKYKKGRTKLKAGGTVKGKSKNKGKLKISLKGKIAGNAAGKTKTNHKTKEKKQKKDTPKIGTPKKPLVQQVPEKPQNTAKDNPKENTPEEVEYQTPPDEPSENDFGYEKPVYGCFEGEVMFIEPNSKKLPANYSKYDVASVLYACEWDIPARSFDTGFPGVEGQFEWFAIRYSGAFGIQKAGAYTFRINSDDGAKLYIDGKLVVDNDGVHAPKSQKGTIELTAGDHEMVLEYFQGPRYYIALQLFVTPPEGDEGIFSVR